MRMMFIALTVMALPGLALAGEADVVAAKARVRGPRRAQPAACGGRGLRGAWPAAQRSPAPDQLLDAGPHYFRHYPLIISLF